MRNDLRFVDRFRIAYSHVLTAHSVRAARYRLDSNLEVVWRGSGDRGSYDDVGHINLGGCLRMTKCDIATAGRASCLSARPYARGQNPNRDRHERLANAHSPAALVIVVKQHVSSLLPSDVETIDVVFDNSRLETPRDVAMCAIDVIHAQLSHPNSDVLRQMAEFFGSAAARYAQIADPDSGTT